MSVAHRRPWDREAPPAANKPVRARSPPIASCMDWIGWLQVIVIFPGLLLWSRVGARHHPDGFENAEGEFEADGRPIVGEPGAVHDRVCSDVVAILERDAHRAA